MSLDLRGAAMNDLRLAYKTNCYFRQRRKNPQQAFQFKYRSKKIGPQDGAQKSFSQYLAATNIEALLTSEQTNYHPHDHRISMSSTSSKTRRSSRAPASGGTFTSERVHVIVRCRPPNAKERGHGLCVQCVSPATSAGQCREVQVTQTLVHGKEMAKTFSFDQAYGPNTTQRDLFARSMKPIVDEVLAGYNCTIFAYGQTSTGKTYTMEGDRGNGKKRRAVIDSKAGVIQRSVGHIFQTLDANRSDYTVKVSCMELYNEELQDLLTPDDTKDPAKHEKLRIYEDKDGRGTMVNGLEETIVRDANHILSILDQASRKRQMAETQLNHQSSRSHAITTITIHIKDSGIDGEEVVKTGKLNLVDLAGSENIGRSGALDKRAKEAGMINQSLLTLGRVITSLCNHQPHVPYRESKLTRLLQDSLGGKTKTCIIATISPSVSSLEETLSTLDYAHRAKNIHNKPEVNMKIAKGALITEMTTDMAKLKAELQMQRDRSGGVFISQEAYQQKEETLRQQYSQIEIQEQRIEAFQKEIEEMTEDNNAICEELDRSKLKLEKAQTDLTEARVTINLLKQQNNTLEKKIREHQYVYYNTKEANDTLFDEAGQLLDDLHNTRQSEDLLQEKIHRHRQADTENNSEKGRFRQEMLTNLENMKQRAEDFLSQHMDKYRSMSQLLDSQKQQQQTICNSLEHQSHEMVDTFINEHINKRLKEQIVDQQYATKQGNLLTAHTSMLDQFERSLSHHTGKVETAMKLWSQQFGTQVQEQHRTLSNLQQELEKRTLGCQEELQQFLKQQLSRLGTIEESVMNDYSMKELLRFEQERANIVRLQKQFQTRHTTLRQQLIDRFTNMVEQQTQEHEQQMNTLVDNITGSLAQTESNLKEDMLQPLQKILSNEMRTQMSNHLNCRNSESMLHKLDQEICKNILSGSMLREVNANRFGPLQNHLNKNIIEDMVESEHGDILSSHVPILQRSIQEQRDHLSELQNDFSAKVFDIREEANSYFEENQLDTLASWERNQKNDLAQSKHILDNMLSHVTTHQQQDLVPSLEQHMDADVESLTVQRLKRLLPTGMTPPRNKKRRIIPVNNSLLPNSKSYDEYVHDFYAAQEGQNTESEEEDKMSDIESSNSNISQPEVHALEDSTAVLLPSNKANIQWNSFPARDNNDKSTASKGKEVVATSALKGAIRRTKQRSVSAAASLGSPLAGRKFVRSRSKRRLEAAGTTAHTSKTNAGPLRK